MEGRGRPVLTHVPIGALGVFGLLVLVVTIGLFGPKRASSESVSTPPAITTASPPAAIQTDSPRATTAATPRPTPQPTLAPGSLFVGYPGWAMWSPDGTRIAISNYEEVDASRLANVVLILDRDGRQIDRFEADTFLWLDSGAYVTDTVEDGGLGGAVTVGKVGSPDRIHISVGMRLAAVGLGDRLALVSPGPISSGTTFMVWSPSGSLRPAPGMPIAFSRDGSLLAVALVPAGWDESAWSGNPAPEVATTLLVIDTRSGKTVASTSRALWPSSQVAFSPDGRYLAILEKPSTASSPRQLGLMQLPSGPHWQADCPEQSFLDWSDKGHLTVWTDGTPVARAPQLPVSVQFTRYGTVPGTAVSSAGWSMTWTPEGTLLVTKPVGKRSIDMGARILSATWSPQGTELLVVWGSATLTSPDGGGYAETAQFVSIVRP